MVNAALRMRPRAGALRRSFALRRAGVVADLVRTPWSGARAKVRSFQFSENTSHIHLKIVEKRDRVSNLPFNRLCYGPDRGKTTKAVRE
jgi:hypothetical protein